MGSHEEAVRSGPVQLCGLVRMISGRRRGWPRMLPSILGWVVGPFMCGDNTQWTQVGQLRRIVGRSGWSGEAARPRESRVDRILPRIPGRCVVTGVGVAREWRFWWTSMFGGEVVVRRRRRRLAVSRRRW